MVRGDSNDYSRFNDIGSDDEKPKEEKKKVSKKAVVVKPVKCASCGAEPEKLRSCSICKKVGYCSEQCQRDDWRFHKRVCAKPKEAKPKGDAKKSSSSSSSSGGGVKKRTPAVVEVDDNDDCGDEDKTPITWYKHRETKLPPSENACVKLAQAPPSPPQPLERAASSGSVWNTAGTWEEREVLPWCKKRIEDLFGGATAPSRDFGSGQVRVIGVDSVEGDASVGVIRGKPRHIIDVTITLRWEARVGGRETVYRGKMVIADFTQEVSAEAAEELPVAVTFTDEKKAGAALAREIKAQVGGGQVKPTDSPASLAADVLFALKANFVPAFMAL